MCQEDLSRKLDMNKQDASIWADGAMSLKELRELMGWGTTKVWATVGRWKTEGLPVLGTRQGQRLPRRSVMELIHKEAMAQEV